MLLLLGCAGSSSPPVGDAGATSTGPGPEVVTKAAAQDALVADLTGGAEVPGPGDPDGTGSATIVPAPERGEVCFTLVVDGLPELTGAQLHEAPPPQSGPVVLALALPPDGGEGCATADEQLLLRLGNDPGRFYVNVYTDEFPDGAVRGQLRRGVART